MFIFPRKHFKDHFIRDGPPGCSGAATPSGWMQVEEFLQFLKLLVRNTHAAKDHPLLVLLDNHHLHLDMNVLNFAKANNIILLSFPPHCSHKLQPLDVSVFGPLKKLVASVQGSWVRSNPGKTMCICDLPSIVKDSWPRAAVPINIIKGFEAAGISPFNLDIFTEADFAPSFVTDRPLNESSAPGTGTDGPLSKSLGPDIPSLADMQHPQSLETPSLTESSNKQINSATCEFIALPTVVVPYQECSQALGEHNPMKAYLQSLNIEAIRMPGDVTAYSIPWGYQNARWRHCCLHSLRLSECQVTSLLPPFLEAIRMPGNVTAASIPWGYQNAR